MSSGEDQLPELESAVAPTENPADSRLPWAAIAWFGILLILAYLPILKHLVEQWWNDPDVGHGFFVPLVSGYVVWQRRDRLMALKWKPAWWGIALMAWGGFQAYI